MLTNEKTKQSDKEQKQSATDGPSEAVLAILKTASNHSLIAGATVKDLTLPEFIPPSTIPIGGVVIGKIIEVMGDFTGNPDMAETQNLIMQAPVSMAGEKPKKFLFPVTGELGQSMLRIPQPHAGKIISIKRLEDRRSKKFKTNIQYHLEIGLIELDKTKESVLFPMITN